VILPVHNEQATLASTLSKVQQYLQRHSQVTCVFIDDGSIDRSRDLITRAIHHARTPQLQMLSYKPHAGKGYAVKLGMQAAVTQCDYLCLLDGDLAYSLDHLDDLITALQHSDIAIGNRHLGIVSIPKRAWLPWWISTLFTQMARKLLGIPYTDPQAGLKGFRAVAAQRLFSHQSLQGFGFDLELLYLAQKYGYTLVQVAAQESQPHQLKVSQVNFIKDHLGMIKDVMQIRFYDWVGRYR
jgi:glycosyltransferase involved in cell wall biosynthesis